MFRFNPIHLWAVAAATLLVGLLSAVIIVGQPAASALEYHLGIQSIALALGLAAVLTSTVLSVGNRAQAVRLATLLLAVAGTISLLNLPALSQVAVDAQSGNALGTSNGATVVELPYGQYAAGIQSILSLIMTAVITLVAAYLPFPLRGVIAVWGADRLAKDAARLAVASTIGADPEAKLKVDVGSKVLARAANYFIQEASPKMIKALGGVEGIQNKIIGYMNLDHQTTAGEVKAQAAPLIDASKIK